MSDYRPIDFDADVARLKDKLEDAGALAAKLFSCASREENQQVADMFEAATQRVTATLLELQIAEQEIRNEASTTRGR